LSEEIFGRSEKIMFFIHDLPPPSRPVGFHPTTLVGQGATFQEEITREYTWTTSFTVNPLRGERERGGET